MQATPRPHPDELVTLAVEDLLHGARRRCELKGERHPPCAHIMHVVHRLESGGMVRAFEMPPEQHGQFRAGRSLCISHVPGSCVSWSEALGSAGLCGPTALAFPFQEHAPAASTLSSFTKPHDTMSSPKSGSMTLRSCASTSMSRVGACVQECGQRGNVQGCEHASMLVRMCGTTSSPGPGLFTLCSNMLVGACMRGYARVEV